MHSDMTRASLEEGEWSLRGCHPITSEDGHAVASSLHIFSKLMSHVNLCVCVLVSPTPLRVCCCAGFQHMLCTAGIMGLFTPHYPVNK